MLPSLKHGFGVLEYYWGKTSLLELLRTLAYLKWVSCRNLYTDTSSWSSNDCFWSFTNSYFTFSRFPVLTPYKLLMATSISLMDWCLIISSSFSSLLSRELSLRRGPILVSGGIWIDVYSWFIRSCACLRSRVSFFEYGPMFFCIRLKYFWAWDRTYAHSLVDIMTLISFHFFPLRNSPTKKRRCSSSVHFPFVFPRPVGKGERSSSSDSYLWSELSLTFIPDDIIIVVCLLKFGDPPTLSNWSPIPPFVFYSSVVGWWFTYLVYLFVFYI